MSFADLFTAPDDLEPFEAAPSPALPTVPDGDPEAVLLESIRSRSLANLDVLVEDLGHLAIEPTTSFTQKMAIADFSYKVSGMAAKQNARENAAQGVGRVIINFIRGPGRDAITIDHPVVQLT